MNLPTDLIAMGALMLIVASFSDRATGVGPPLQGTDRGPPGWSTHCIDNGPTCLRDRCKAGGE